MLYLVRADDAGRISFGPVRARFRLVKPLGDALIDLASHHFDAEEVALSLIMRAHGHPSERNPSRGKA